MRLHRLPNGATAARYPAVVYQWRGQVQQAVAAAFEGSDTITGAVELGLGFDLPRPVGHFLPVNGRRDQPELRPGAPAYPVVAPDLDKLVRAICDACTDAGAWADDAQVVSLRTAKRYAAPPGVLITITQLPNQGGPCQTTDTYSSRPINPTWPTTTTPVTDRLSGPSWS
jgi:Holliday junction resolvase RusA-like endonuclease